MGIIEKSTRLPVMYGIVVCTVTIGTLFVSSSIDQNTRNTKQYESFNSAAQRAARKLMEKPVISDKAIHVLENYPLHKEYFYDDSFSSLQYDVNRMEHFLPFFPSSESYEYSEPLAETDKNDRDNHESLKPHEDRPDEQLTIQQSTEFHQEKPFIEHEQKLEQPQKTNQQLDMAPQQPANKLEPPSDQEYQSNSKQPQPGDRLTENQQMTRDQQSSGQQQQEHIANHQNTVNMEPATQQKQLQGQPPISFEAPLKKELEPSPNEQRQPSNLGANQQLHENKMSSNNQQSLAKEQFPASPLNKQLTATRDEQVPASTSNMKSPSQKLATNQQFPDDQKPPTDQKPVTFDAKKDSNQLNPPENAESLDNHQQDVNQQSPANQKQTMDRQQSPAEVMQQSSNQQPISKPLPSANQQPELNVQRASNQQLVSNQEPSPNIEQAPKGQPSANQQPSLNQMQDPQQKPPANQQQFLNQAQAPQGQPPANQQPSHNQAEAPQLQPPANQQQHSPNQESPQNQQLLPGKQPSPNKAPPSNQQLSLKKKQDSNQISSVIKQPPTKQKPSFANKKPTTNQQQPQIQAPLPSKKQHSDKALAANSQPSKKVESPTNDKIKREAPQNVLKAISNVTGNKNDSCQSIKLMPKGTMPLVALLSSPGSGNTWTRFLIEHATGIYTGSVYYDSALFKGGFLGELEDVHSGTTVVTKTHFFPRSQEYHYSKVILLVRNPYKCILSEFNRQKAQAGSNYSHIAYADPSLFQTSNWTQYAKGAADRWYGIIKAALNTVKPSNVLLVYYESLVVDVSGPLEKIVRFLNLPVEKSRLECTKRMADKSGFHRPHKSLGFDPYNEELTNRIQTNIELATQLILQTYNTTFPKYEKETFK